MIQRKIFCFWTGDNEISEIRRRCVESLADSGLMVCLVTNHNLHEFIPEVGRWGVGNCYQNAILLNEGGIFNKFYYYVKWRFLQLNYKKLIGNGAFIFKPQTPITQEWWNELNSRLDKVHDKLLAHPAKYPKERMGHVYDGVVSQYPVPWSYLLGDILAPIILKHSSKVLKNLPPPSFENYQ